MLKTQSIQGVSEFLHGTTEGIQNLLEMVQEQRHIVGDNGAVGRGLDQPLMFKDPEGVAHLVLGDVELLGQPDDPDRLVLHDRLQHLHVPAEEIDLPLDLAGQDALSLDIFPSISDVIDFDIFDGIADVRSDEDRFNTMKMGTWSSGIRSISGFGDRGLLSVMEDIIERIHLVFHSGNCVDTIDQRIM